MRKKTLFIYCITLMIICQGLIGVTAEAGAISLTKAETITERCTAVQNQLRVVQRDDTKTRFYLGRYYETILNRFITPLNMRLTENNMMSEGFMGVQSDFAKARTNFTIDFIEYQRGMDDLVVADCKAEPENFYAQLEKVRDRRAKVADDVMKLRNLMDVHRGLVVGLMEEV